MSMGLYEPSTSEIFDLTVRKPPKSEPEPVLGDVRCAINSHPSTEGNFRFRIAINKETFSFLTAGLADPRVRLEGDVGCGIKISCNDKMGVKPTYQHHQVVVSVPIRTMRGREEPLTSSPVTYEKAYDDNGPVLLIPTLPEEFLPDRVRSRIPPSKRTTLSINTVKRSNAVNLREAADQLFKTTVAEQDLKDPFPVAVEPEQVIPDVVPEPVADLVPDFFPAPDVKVERTVYDLKVALEMVNEIAAELGEEVVLFTCSEGRAVHARRRVTQFVDL